MHISTKREGPPPISISNLPLEDIMDRTRQKNLLWLLAHLHDTENQMVSSWIGFSIKTRDDVMVKLDKVGYLSTINAPSAELSTVQEILS